MLAVKGSYSHSLSCYRNEIDLKWRLHLAAEIWSFRGRYSGFPLAVLQSVLWPYWIYQYWLNVLVFICWSLINVADLMKKLRKSCWVSDWVTKLIGWCPAFYRLSLDLEHHYYAVGLVGTSIVAMIRIHGMHCSAIYSIAYAVGYLFGYCVLVSKSLIRKKKPYMSHLCPVLGIYRSTSRSSKPLNHTSMHATKLGELIDLRYMFTNCEKLRDDPARLVINKIINPVKSL